MTRVPHGLTLVETAIVLTIGGFVAAFALPAYRDYTTREKVAEVIAAAASAKATVEEYAGVHGELPSSAAISLPFVNSRYVLTNGWAAAGANGAVSVLTRPATSPDDSALDAKAIVWSASYNPATRAVDWTCGGTAATTVAARFLPDDCR